MSWDSFKSLVPGFMKNSGLSGPLKSQRVIEVSSQVLVMRWGKEKAALVSVRSFNQGVLDLVFVSPAAMQTLRMEKVAFINAVNNNLGEKLILDIKFSRQNF